jgi:hypothetical protein
MKLVLLMPKGVNNYNYYTVVECIYLQEWLLVMKNYVFP